MPRIKSITAEIDTTIGTTLRAIRTAAGMSQSALAEKIGITFQQIQKYETGKNRVSVSTLILICRALAISPMEIIGPHVGEKSDLSGLTTEIAKLRKQLADIRSAAK